jgi:transcriptional regulator with XRE-family HTH domain
MSIATIELPSDLVRDVERALPRALHGEAAAARRYVKAWRGLVRALLASHDAAAAAADVLDHLALTAPFHPDGPINALLSAATGIISGMRPSAVSSPPAPLPAPLEYERFAVAVLHELSGPGSDLARLMAGWELSISDVARLFGVSRQAVQQWLDGGVPAARQPKLLQILRIGDLLERNLEPLRIPAVVRSDAGAYGGRSMLEMIADDRYDELLESVERSFDWASTA